LKNAKTLLNTVCKLNKADQLALAMKSAIPRIDDEEESRFFVLMRWENVGDECFRDVLGWIATVKVINNKRPKITVCRKKAKIKN
jgi:hypothetical protein